MKTVYDLFPDIDRHRQRENFPDIKDAFFWETFEKCKPHSMLSVEGFYNLFRSVEYIARNRIPGDFVECGVFLGGSVLAMSEFAHHFGLSDRIFHLYDTFSGFPEGTTEVDPHGEKRVFGTRRGGIYDASDEAGDARQKRASVQNRILEQVRHTLTQSRHPQERFRLVPGMVEETLKQDAPATLALLRLDTDYYASTKVELEHLYPRLASGGVIIIDDYGHFEGVRRATEEYFATRERSVLFSRVSYTIRCGVKP